MTCCTRSTVACATPQRPLTTFDTVATETPALRATSDIFTRCEISTEGMIVGSRPRFRKRYRQRLTAPVRAVTLGRTERVCDNPSGGPMRTKRRTGALFALLAATALVANGCSSGGDGGGDTQNKSDLYKN